MEQKLLSLLDTEEKLLWSGVPEPFEMMGAAYKSKLIRKFLLTAAGIIGLSAWYITAALKNGVAVQPIAIIICALPFLYSIYNDFSDVKKLKGKTIYAMTDRRMITVVDKAASYIEYGKVRGWKLEADDDGVMSFVCGDDALKAKAVSRRAAAVCGAHTNIDTDLCESYVMYGITQDADKIEKIAAQYMPA